jgi:hypothetical protein
MKSRLLIDGPEKTWTLILSTGDEAASALEKFANENKLRGSHFSAIGAFVRTTLGYFDWEKKDYVKIRIEEQVEVLSLLGDVALTMASRRFTPTSWSGGATAPPAVGICSKESCDPRSKSSSASRRSPCKRSMIPNRVWL